MAESSNSSPVEAIGLAAGTVWQVLNAKGPLTLNHLVKAAGGNKELVLEALGWLAREDKISIAEHKRTKTISLR